MTVKWTGRAVSDLVRLHKHLGLVAPRTAVQVIQRLAHAPVRLRAFPRIGEKLDGYAPREVRRIWVGNYELRYEIADAVIYVLRLWPGRENREFGPSA